MKFTVNLPFDRMTWRPFESELRLVDLSNRCDNSKASIKTTDSSLSSRSNVADPEILKCRSIRLSHESGAIVLQAIAHLSTRGTLINRE